MKHTLLLLNVEIRGITSIDDNEIYFVVVEGENKGNVYELVRWEKKAYFFYMCSLYTIQALIISHI